MKEHCWGGKEHINFTKTLIMDFYDFTETLKWEINFIRPSESNDLFNRKVLLATLSQAAVNVMLTYYK